ncbi:M20/M25/M40 family metallo-hydrolase [Roseomonas hellenica]|uniref:M20/M25/M40 family metallo-hydrolase n=1 Tax=Plastoroseomonas hellenica TaxID=2687306 RepID=A0ABS5F3B0_9PROT|nr:M20/M25/M40 family metallo-hydrolase [Plastoroseomonas hellenica]MBR0667006.1 M20/M25/M40 family metallo-hydrolase [Plastoroseomonas hellenica]
MGGSRDAAIERAHASFDEGRFLERLRQLVAVPTESHPPGRRPELEHYARDVLGPMVAGLGFEVRLLENPEAQHGPVMLATRTEHPSLPTILIYGHGDVVRAMPELWRKDLDPWTVTVEGDRLYGRGVVDNKGQHLVAIEALAAVLAERGRLGFNVKLMVETGEEAGSPGLQEILRRDRALCAADVFIAFDGLRQSTTIPEVTLGTRGSVAMDLVVALREGGFHSGHWGGLLTDPGVILSHAIASIVSQDGRILVPGWTPEDIPAAVRAACAAVITEDLQGAPSADRGWGEPGMTRAERIFMWTSVIVLAAITGEPASPVNAVGGSARARIQVRHTVDVPAERLVPALRAHLDARGLAMVQIHPVTERQYFPASRTDPEDAWVRRTVRSMERTVGRRANIVPNIAASGPSEFFREALGTPVIWIPLSYGGCSQHGPNEHGLGSLFREGLGLIAGLWWDFGAEDPDRADAAPRGMMAGS